MRTAFDSTTASDIPADAKIVCGYANGRFAWTAADWQRFPEAVHVRIAVNAQDPVDAEVLDVETGDALPTEVPDWLVRRRAAGADPTVYVNRSNWQACKDACAYAGVLEPHWWLAAYDGVAEVPAGTVAKQYADEALTGAHYDLSAVADFWPGVDPQGGNVATPQKFSQSAVEVNVKKGEVALLAAQYVYQTGANPRTVEWKVYGPDKTGSFPLVKYPPADVDSDPTENLSAEPSYFLISVREA